MLLIPEDDSTSPEGLGQTEGLCSGARKYRTLILEDQGQISRDFSDFNQVTVDVQFPYTTAKWSNVASVLPDQIH